MTDNTSCEQRNLANIDRLAEQSQTPHLDGSEVPRHDWEDIVEKVATVAGTGLLVVSLLFLAPSGPPDPQTAANHRSATANGLPIQSAVQRVSHPARTRRSAVSHSRELPRLPLWESPLHARIFIQQGTKNLTGYVLRSCLARADFVVRKGDSVSVRSDRNVSYSATGDSAGRIASGTVGTVLKVVDDEVSIRFPARRPLNKVRLKRWHIQPVTGQLDIDAGTQATISAQGGASIIDEDHCTIGHLADGSTVFLPLRQNRYFR